MTINENQEKQLLEFMIWTKIALDKHTRLSPYEKAELSVCIKDFQEEMDDEHP